MLCSLVEAIRECGIPFTVRIGKVSKKVEFSSLLGEDRKKLLHAYQQNLVIANQKCFHQKSWIYGK